MSLSGHRLSTMKNDFFLRLVQPPYKKFPHPPSGYSIFAMLPKFAPADHGKPHYSDTGIPLGSGSDIHAIVSSCCLSATRLSKPSHAARAFHEERISLCLMRRSCASA